MESSFTLPAIFDAENNPLTIKHLSMPSFAIFNEGTYIFKPNKLTDIGQIITIYAYVTDSQLSTPFEFKVEV